MVKLLFMDGKCEYDDHVVIFFETLKKHAEVYGYFSEIDLRVFGIKKEEFDNILNMCEGFVRNNMIPTRVNNAEQYDRPNEIKKYLGLFFRDIEFGCMSVTFYCSKFGLLDILKYAHQCGCGIDGMDSQIAAESGHIECLKYAHENGGTLFFECENTRARASSECFKYVQEHGYPIHAYPTVYSAFGPEWY